MSIDQLTSPSGKYRLNMAPDELLAVDPNPNRREHPIVLLKEGREVARVLSYNPWIDLGAVTDDGVFLIGDWGPENKNRYGIVSVFDASGRQLFKRTFRANLGATAISQDGRRVLVETLVSNHEDSNSLFLFDVALSALLWRREREVAARSWTIDSESIWADCDHLGRFRIGTNGEFDDKEEYERACVSKGRLEEFENAVRSWLKAEEPDETRIELALLHADRLISDGFEAYAHLSSDASAKVLRLKGELHEAKGDQPSAAQWYRLALARDPKVGVKRRLRAIEKQLPTEVVTSLRQEFPLDESERQRRTPVTQEKRSMEPIALVAFDLETTGLDSRTCEIIEIGAVRFDLTGAVLDTFQALAKPRREIPQQVVDKTGITGAMVADAKPSCVVVQEFSVWVGDQATLVAHNATFDTKFLVKAYQAAQTPLPSWGVVDTLAWARTRKLPVRNNQLQTLLTYINKPPNDQHRALADAQGVADLTLFLSSQEKHQTKTISRRVRTLENMAASWSFDQQSRDLRAPAGRLSQVDPEHASHLPNHKKPETQRKNNGCLAAGGLAIGLVLFSVALMVRLL